MNGLVVNVPQAVQDQIREQVLFIARRSPFNALRWERRLRDYIAALGAAPTHTPDAAATSRMGREICKVVFERTYLVFYEVDPARIALDLINFRHGARLPRRGEP